MFIYPYRSGLVKDLSQFILRQFNSFLNSIEIIWQFYSIYI